jgi:Right handed beta helix region/Bacterial Ig domain
MRLFVLTIVAAAALGLSAPAESATYYVNTSGNDTATGTTSISAWRTINRVNRASLAPGDSVLFQGGQTFSDETLMPSVSGTSSTPIRYGSYGTGEANLGHGIWMISIHDLVFDNLAVIGSDQTMQGIASTASGTGVANITVQNCTLKMLSIGVNLPNPADANWTIKNNEISQIGDSGLIIQGKRIKVNNNVITDVGQNKSISYAKQGVYAKGPNIEVSGNTITGFSDSGVSIRYQNDVVINNLISSGPIGVSYFQYSDTAGTSVIAYNRIANVTAAGIYLDPSTVESFVIANNSIQTTGGAGMDLRTARNLTVANNAVFGKSVYALTAKSPTGSYSEHHNLWYSDSGTLLLFNGTQSTLAAYQSRTGQGAKDLSVKPVVDGNYALSAGSPLIDQGTTAVTGTTYSVACDRLPMHYCGTFPDIGAVESLSSVVVTSAPTADTTAPRVVITSPTRGKKLKRSITARATARDSGGIRRVFFVVDKKMVCARTHAPFKCSMSLNKGKHTIVVRAIDRAGNVGSASVRARCKVTSRHAVSRAKKKHAVRHRQHR